MADPRRNHQDQNGADSAGQSGDIQQAWDEPEADSESEEELLEEGNAYEAEVIYGIENVPPADEAEVTTRQVSEDDVPEEYLGNNNDAG